MPKLVAKKQDWIDLGYRLFSEKGIAGIVIEKMAAQLGCNKSSFYWHFKTKKDFVAEMIRHWIRTETEQIIEAVESAAQPKDKWTIFLQIAFKNDPYLEFIFFLKRYAQKNREVQRIIDQVDARRLAFTAQLLAKNGYSKKEAVVKARIFYNYLIGYHEMLRNKKQSKEYLSEVKEDLQHFLVL
ncbi:MAG: TetR/AcrR family transcriptional regulator [Bacteroidota bacterium]